MWQRRLPHPLLVYRPLSPWPASAPCPQISFHASPASQKAKQKPDQCSCSFSTLCQQSSWNQWNWAKWNSAAPDCAALSRKLQLLFLTGRNFLLGKVEQRKASTPDVAVEAAKRLKRHYEGKKRLKKLIDGSNNELKLLHHAAALHWKMIFNKLLKSLKRLVE